jgi:integrase
VAEAQRLLNAADGDFRLLLRGALETGMRYGELITLDVADFNPDAGTIHVRRSKSGKERHVILTDEGRAFFTQITAGRRGLMFTTRDGPWRKSYQQAPMAAACKAARLSPPITFHGLRHTWASLSVMNGVPLQIVAANLGHRDTRMCEKHYAHLAPSYVADAIRAGAPKFGQLPVSNVALISPKGR